MAFLFITHEREISETIAGCLLGGIISDTLNLSGPTTTPADVEAVQWLAPRAGLESGDIQGEVNRLALAQFSAKANLSGWSDSAIITSDLKTYQMATGDGGTVTIAWGTVECVEPQYSEYKQPDRLRGLVEAARKEKQPNANVELLFLSVVDVMGGRSFIVGPSGAEQGILEKMYPGMKWSTGTADGEAYFNFDSTPRVSRKTEFIPPLRAALASRSTVAQYR
jgi:manganese-dependent inorganic pyrophosphatase